MRTVNDMSMAHINDPPKHVKHADLIRIGDSKFKSSCPVCVDGMLLVYRHPITFRLTEEDRCVLCGQQFIYDDIEEMRQKEERCPTSTPTLRR
jgi:hypothetical protein